MRKINHKILSIPPYVSTSWKNVNTLHVKGVEGRSVLVIMLHNGTIIDIPNLDPELIQQVFAAHTNYIEQEAKEPESVNKGEHPRRCEGGNVFSFGIPFQMGGMDHISSLLQHNPEQSTAAQMSSEMLQKITSVIKSLGVNLEQMNLPKAEPHCNCPYCQIARAMQDENEGMMGRCEEEGLEEEVSEEDLRFRDWDIRQEGDKLYIVTNPLDAKEVYQVFLGNPVGCTCGQKNCEHVRTVLNS